MSNLCFICAPYGGKPENITLTRRYMRMAAAAGMVPISLPVMLHGILDDHDLGQRLRGIAAGHRLMEQCEVMWICGDTMTPGMDGDVRRAGWHVHKYRKVSMAELVEWETGQC